MRNEVFTMTEEALKMSHIVKVYPNGVMANKDVTLAVRHGEIHALSGENGAASASEKAEAPGKPAVFSLAGELSA